MSRSAEARIGRRAPSPRENNVCRKGGGAFRHCPRSEDFLAFSPLTRLRPTGYGGQALALSPLRGEGIRQGQCLNTPERRGLC